MASNCTCCAIDLTLIGKHILKLTYRLKWLIKSHALFAPLFIIQAVYFYPSPLQAISEDQNMQERSNFDNNLLLDSWIPEPSSRNFRIRESLLSSSLRSWEPFLALRNLAGNVTQAHVPCDMTYNGFPAHYRVITTVTPFSEHTATVYTIRETFQLTNFTRTFLPAVSFSALASCSRVLEPIRRTEGPDVVKLSLLTFLLAPLDCHSLNLIH